MQTRKEPFSLARWRNVAVALSFLIAWACQPAAGQTVNGSFRGKVTDPSGAVIPGASVTMTDTAKGKARDTKTDASGYYEFLDVPPSTYDFTVSFTAFQTLNDRGVVLLVNQNAALDFSLQPGTVTQKVSVTAQAPLINTTNSTVGTVVDHQQTVDLPLNGRQFSQMILLTPGVAPQGSDQHSTFEVNTNVNGISPAVNGVRPDMNNFTIDGVENNELFFNFLALSPPPDAIQEFNVQSYISSGAYGRAPGANVAIVTRSGTNQFHGDAWEFLRNDVLDARNFFAADRSPFRQNQFGGTAGGPLRKDKIWAFGWYEGLRKSLGSVNLGTVPTPAELSGNLSELSQQIYNPFSTTLTGYDSSGNPIFARTAFPSNQIPSSLLNPTSLALAQHFYPTPNLPIVPGQPNFINTQPVITTINQWSARVDAALAKSTSLFARVTWENGEVQTPGLIPNTGSELLNPNVQAVLGLTHSTSPSTVISFHMQFLRTYPLLEQYGSCLPVSQQQSLGLLRDWPGQEGVSTGPCNPGISISDVAGPPGQLFIPLGPANNWQYLGDITKIKGRHTITFGGSVMRSWLHSDNAYASASFNNLPTSDPQNSASTGSGLASYLLGIPSAGNRQAGDGGQSLFGNYYALYVNDQVRISPKLTATLGVRYDYASPLQDTRGRVAAVNWDASTPTNVIYDVDQNATELNGITLVPHPAPGITVVRSRPALYDPQRTNFSPRVALAYQVKPTTTAHAGYGIFYDFNQNLFQQQDDIMGNWPFGNPVFTYAGYNQPTVANPLPTNIFGVNVFPPVTFTSVPPLGSGFVAQPHDYVTPYVQEWNVGVDHAFGNNWSLSVTYVGSKGTHLGGNTNVNTADSPGPGPVVPRSRLPNLLGVYTLDGHWFNSSYNAGQVKVEKRYSQGLTLLGSYTYSHSIDNVSVNTNYVFFQNPLNFQADRASSDFDLTHNFVLSCVYYLPFGKGKKYANGGGALSRYVLGGWWTSGIVTLNNGFPFNITIPFDNANVGEASQRPSVRGPLVPPGFHQTANAWFDTSALYVVPYTFGNLGRNAMREDGYKNLDFSLAKDTQLTERASLQLRFEFFNVLNHPNFGVPDSSLGDPTFGSVLIMNGSPRNIQFGVKLQF